MSFYRVIWRDQQEKLHGEDYDERIRAEGWAGIISRTYPDRWVEVMHQYGNEGGYRLSMYRDGTLFIVDDYPGKDHE